MYQSIEEQFIKSLCQRTISIRESSVNLQSAMYEGLTKGTIEEQLTLWKQFYRETKRAYNVVKVYNFFYNRPKGKEIESELVLALKEINDDQIKAIKRIAAEIERKSTQ